MSGVSRNTSELVNALRDAAERGLNRNQTAKFLGISQSRTYKVAKRHAIVFVTGWHNSHIADIMTASHLRRILSYDLHSGIFIWIVSPATWIKIGDIAGTSSHGYIAIKIGKSLYPAHRLAWLWMTGEWPKYQIDHIDRIPSNNRWNNLREATQSQNNANKPAQKNNTSGFKGVCWDKSANKYFAQIRVNGRNIALGHRIVASEAAVLYAEAAKKYFGEFARTL